MKRRSGINPELIQVTREKQGSVHQSDWTLRGRYAADCVNCGACCSMFFHANRPTRSVELDLKEIREKHLWHWVQRQSLTKIWVLRYQLGKPIYQRVRYFLRKILNDEGWWTCAALRGQIGVKVSCAVYSHRPDTCKHFAVGVESKAHY